MTVTNAQRFYGLIMAGHNLSQTAYIMGATESAVKTAIKDLTQPQTTTQDQRIHDLVAAGHSVPTIAHMLDLSYTVVETSIRDLTKAVSGSNGAHTGSP